jgi:glycerophosphoryl diester phosphodiesterase
MPNKHLSLLAALLAAVLSPPAAAIEIACHRGANEVAPENTRAAAEKCIQWGADYVEIDVRTSKDGVMYIMHDPFVTRTTNGKGLLRQLTSAQIDNLDAGSWFDAKFAGEKVPRLEPYLRWIKGKAKIYFDVKDADLKQLIDLVRDIGLENDCFFWFENPKKATEFRRLDKNLPLKMNARNPKEVAADQQLGANIIEVSPQNLTAEMVAACHQRGLKLMVYEPERNLETFRQAIKLGADLINLNHADAFIQVRRELEHSQ